MGIVDKVRGNIYCMLNNADILQARRLIWRTFKSERR